MRGILPAGGALSLRRLLNRIALLVLVAATAFYSIESVAQTQSPCEDSYTNAVRVIRDAKPGTGVERKLTTKVDNAWRMYRSASDKGQENALKELDQALALLGSPATKQVPPAVAATIRTAINGFRDCLRSAPALGVATANVRVYLPNHQNPTVPGASAADTATVYVNGTSAGDTKADGSLSVRIPAGIPVLLSAQVFPDMLGNAEVTLAPGAVTNVDILLSGDQTVSEPAVPAVDEIQDDVYPRDAAGFTFRFLSGDATIRLTELEAVTAIDPTGFQTQLPGDFKIGKKGEIAASNVAAVKTFLATMHDPITVTASGYDEEGRSYRGSVRFYYGRYSVTAKIIAPPSNRQLNVGGAFVELTELNSNLTFRAVSDAAGNLPLPLLPGGEYQVSGSILAGAIPYQLMGGFTLEADTPLTLVAVTMDDVVAGVRWRCLCAPSALQSMPKMEVTTTTYKVPARESQQGPKVAPDDTVIVSARVSSENSPPGSVRADRSEILSLPPATEQLKLEYTVTSAELAAGRDLTKFNDRWGIFVMEAGNLSNWYQRTDRPISTTPFVGGAFRVETPVNVKYGSPRNPREFRVIVSAENGGDSQFPTQIIAYLQNVEPTALTVSVTRVQRDDVDDHPVGGAHLGQHNYYSIPRAGERNVYQRDFKLTIEKSQVAAQIDVVVTRLNADTGAVLQATPALTNVRPITGTNDYQVQVTYPPTGGAASSINSVPPPAHRIRYRFDVTARNGGATATTSATSDASNPAEKYALWRMPAGILRFGGGHNPGDGDLGGDNWTSRGTYGWLLDRIDNPNQSALITRINDISGEHGADLRHAGHYKGSDIDLFHYHNVFPNYTDTPANDPSGTILFNALADCVLRAATDLNSNDPNARALAQQCRAAAGTYFSTTRTRFNQLLPMDTVRQVITALGIPPPPRQRPCCGPRPVPALPTNWAENLLRFGATPTTRNGTLDLGIGEWNNRNHAKMMYLRDHHHHNHLTLDPCQVDNIECPRTTAHGQCVPALISSQPQSVTIERGQSATLSVSATGSTPIDYRWFVGPVDELDVSQQIGSGRTITVSPLETTSYWAIANNACGSGISFGVTVTVQCNRPHVTAQPQSATIIAGEQITLNVSASGTAPLSYQWRTTSGTLVGSGPSLTISPSSTTSYVAHVTNACGSTTSAAATITVRPPCVAPAIVQQPQGTTIVEGQSATLTAASTGTAPLVYEWLTSAGAPAGNGASINVAPTATTSYSVRVSNACGNVTSSSATVTVTPACTGVTITAQPQSASIIAGQSATLTVAGSGTAPLTYQWFRADNTAVGSGASLTISPAATTSYYARVSNACGSATSATVTVTVIPACTAPAIAAQPAGTTISEGATATLTVSATGSAPLTYQWFTSGNVPVPSGTGSSVTVSPAQTTSYSVVVSNSCGSVTSAAATVTVVPTCAAPAISSQPASTTITPGGSATLSVGATGTAPLTYHWFTSGNVPVPSGTGSSITVSPAQTTAYSVVVTNSCGTVTSATATVMVSASCVAPTVSTQPASVTITQGASATLAVSANGTAPLSYQWFTSGNVPVSSGTGSALTVSPTQTTAYSVVITNSCGSVTSATATVTVSASCVAPVITTQPASRTITEGASTTLAVSANGTGPLTYQWFTSGNVPVPSGTGAALTVSPSQTTTYSVVVSNACGSVTSSTATVTVTPACTAPVIVTQPSSLTITPGSSATLSVSATGTTPLSYQWFAGSTPLAGTSSALTVAPTQTTVYHVVVSNACGTVTSNTATVTVSQVCTPPAIVSQPQSVAITAGSSATLSVSATGSATLNYQWYTGTNVPAGTGSTIAVSPSQTTSYYVVVANACGSVTSSTATVTVNPVCHPPQITSQPQSVTINVGQSATLTVVSTGTAPLAYQWFRGDGAPVGTSSSLTVSPTATTTYTVRVTNSCGSVTSAVATVTVICNVPVITAQPQDATIASGEAATLTVTATGSSPLDYRWFSGATLVGTGRTIAVTPGETTSYFVRVSNACGTVDSSSVTVTVFCPEPVITLQPLGTTISPGEVATLSVEATTTGFTRYDWYTTSGAHVGSGSTINVSPAVTTSYFVRVWDNCTLVDSDVVTVAVCQPVALTANPSDVTIAAGQSATLSVSASGSGPLQYEWFTFDGALVGTSSSITVSPSVTTTYHARISNACSSTFSQPATVTICTKPTFVSHPQDVTITEGSSATLSAEATGTGPFTYTLIDQDRNWIATNATGTFTVRPPVAGGMNWGYWIIATNACGTEFSNGATVSVCAPPSITGAPQGVTINAGQSATLSVSATGSNLVYEWFTAGGSPAGNGSAITVSPSSTTSYYAVVSNGCGQVTSAAATVTVIVCEPPSILSPTSDTFVLLRYGNTKTLQVSATGTDLQYQWYVATPTGSPFSPLAGETGPSIAVSPDDHTSYYAVVSNGCGSATTATFNVRMWDGIGDPPRPEDPI